MSKIKKHLQEEFEDWEREQLKQLHRIKCCLASFNSECFSISFNFYH